MHIVDKSFLMGQIYAMQETVIQSVVTRNVIMELWATQQIEKLNKQLKENVSPEPPMTEHPAGTE